MSSASWTLDELSDFGTVWTAGGGSRAPSFDTVTSSEFQRLIHPEQDLSGFEAELGVDTVESLVPELLPLWEIALPVGLFVGAVVAEGWLARKLSRTTPQGPSQAEEIKRRESMLGALRLEGSVPFREVRVLRTPRRRRPLGRCRKG